MSSTDLSQLLDSAPVKGIHLRVLGLCTAINVLDGFDLLAISYTAPAISAQWGIDKAALGAVLAAGMAGMTAGSLLLGPLSDRIGRRRAILLCLTLIGLSMALTPLARNAVELILARTVTGLGIGGVLPALNTMVAEFAPERRRNLMVSTMHLGYPLGATGGGFLAAWAIPAIGWEGVFTCGGLMTLALIPATLRWMPESPGFLQALGTTAARGELARLVAEITGSAPAEEQLLQPGGRGASGARSGFLRRLAGLFSTENRTPTLLLWSGYFCGYLTFYFLLSWIPTILVEHGLRLDQAIYAGVALNLGGGLGMLLLGALTGAHNLRLFIAGAFALACIGMMAFGALTLQLAPMLVLTTLLGFFGLAGLIGLYSVAARIYRPAIRATGVGVAVGMGRFGGIAGPVLGGQLMALGWEMRAYFVILGMPLVVAAVAIFAIRSPGLERAPGRA